MEILKNNIGAYTLDLENECRKATIKDFHPDIINAYDNKGLPYFIFSPTNNVYWARRFRKEIKGVQPASDINSLKKYINDENVFVLINTTNHE